MNVSMGIIAFMFLYWLSVVDGGSKLNQNMFGVCVGTHNRGVVPKLEQ